MKIVLFSTKFTSAFSLLCTGVTAYPVSHAGIIQGSTYYDTRATTNKFKRYELEPSDRMVTVYDFPEIDASEYLSKYLGANYDYLGLLTYPFKFINRNIGNSKERMYCFETASRCLNYYGIKELPKQGHVSGKHIALTLANHYDMVGERMTEAQLIKRYLS